MKYGLKLVPQGAIAKDLGIKVKLQPASAPGSAPGVCTPLILGIGVSGNATYDAPDSTSFPTWTWPCNSLPWAILLTGFAIPCGHAYVWTHTIADGPSLGAHLNFVEGTDAQGHPTLEITGDDTTCDDIPAVISVTLGLVGVPEQNYEVQLRPAVALMRTVFATGVFIAGTDEWTWSETFTADGVYNGVLSITMPPGGADATYDFTFTVMNSSGSVTWTVDSSGSDPGFTITPTPSGLSLTISVQRNGGANGLTVNFYAQDDATARYSPVLAPASQFHITG